MTNLVPRLEFQLQALFRRQRQCPHCGERRTHHLARKRGLVSVRRCERCALCFTSPIYKSAMAPLYDKLYEGEGLTTSVPEGAALAELVASNFAGTDKDFGARLATLRRIAPGPRLLELGSSWGYFLHQARAAGFDPTGVEVDPRRRRIARRRLRQDVRRGLDRLGEERFDVIYSAHTLEHFPSLDGVLPELARRLRPGGLLALEVPHFDFAQRGSDSLSIMGAVHPLGFTPEFFERNLPAAGFESIAVYEHWDAVPSTPVRESRSDVVIALARRTCAAEAQAA